MIKSASQIAHEMEQLAHELADAYRNEYRLNGAHYYRKLKKEGALSDEEIVEVVRGGIRDSAMRVLTNGPSHWSGGHSVSNLSEQVRQTVASQDYFGQFRVTLKEILEWCELSDRVDEAAS